MELRKIKVGIIGCGYIASRWHIPGFQRLKKTAAVIAASDISPALVESVARKFNIPRTYSNVTEMLQKEDLEIVDICTPPQTHSSIAIEAMEKGVNVLLEKPMALGLSDCDEMIRISQKTGSKLCIIQNELFRPPLIQARKMVAEGAIGQVMGMQWCRHTHREEYLAKENHWIHRLPGGIISETAPHGIYASLAFLKRITNVEIAAKKLSNYPWAPFDYFDITLEGQDIVSNVIISHAGDNYVADMNIYGTEGVLKLDLQSMLLMHYSLRKTKPILLALSSLKAASQVIGGVIRNAGKIMFTRDALLQVTGHATEIEQFVNSVQNDEQPPVSGEEGRETIRVLELILQKFNQKYARANA
jgi:UDP-N-acetylglucosamine 3-dehydrogenase